MARTHKGGGPPRQSQSSAAQLPSSTSSAAVTTAAGPSSSAQRSPLKPDSASSAAGAKRGVEQAKSGRQTVVLDAAMIRALVGDTGALRGRQQGPSGKAAEVEHVGFKCQSLYPFSHRAARWRSSSTMLIPLILTDLTDKFKPSSVTNQKPGTFTLPSAASSDCQHAVVHLQGANKAEVHGFAAKVEEMSGGAGRDVMLVWDESSQVRAAALAWTAGRCRAFLTPKRPRGFPRFFNSDVHDVADCQDLQPRARQVAFALPPPHSLAVRADAELVSSAPALNEARADPSRNGDERDGRRCGWGSGEQCLI
jgi:hypothetical protein